MAKNGESQVNLFFVIRQIEEMIAKSDFEGAISLALSNKPQQSERYYPLLAKYYFLTCKIALEINFHKIWLDSSIRALSPNILPFMPTDFVDKWLEHLMEIPNSVNFTAEIRDVPSPPGQLNFITCKAEYLQDTTIFGGQIAFIVSVSSLLTCCLASVPVFVEIDDNCKRITTVSLGTTDIEPRKLCRFKSQILTPQDASWIAFSKLLLQINGFNFRFPITSPVEFSRVSIEPCESRIAIRLEAPPVGIAGALIPITIIITSHESCGCIVVYEFKSSNPSLTFSSSQATQSQIDTHIMIEKTNSEYKRCIYVSSPTPVIASVIFQWSIFANERKGHESSDILNIDFRPPFEVESSFFDEAWLKIHSAMTSQTNYIISSCITSKIPWPTIVDKIDLLANDQCQAAFELKEMRADLPIEISSGEKISTFNSIFAKSEGNEQPVGEIRIHYLPKCDLFSAPLTYSISLPSIAVNKKEIDVSFHFPTQGTQHISSSFSVDLVNVTELPIDAVMEVKKSENFFISGHTIVPLALFPGVSASIAFQFFPLVQGSLKFPEIRVFSSANTSKVYWSIQPTIFANFPSDS